MVNDQFNGSVKRMGELDCDAMLYMVPVEQLVCLNCAPEVLNVFKALGAITKDYANKYFYEKPKIIKLLITRASVLTQQSDYMNNRHDMF